MQQQATSNLQETLSDTLAYTANQLIEDLTKKVEAALTIDAGITEIANAFAALDVTVERITLTRNDQILDFPIHENASGIRRDVDAQANGVTMVVTCTSAMTPEANAALQHLVTMAAIAAAQWTAATLDVTPAVASKMIGDSAEMQELKKEITSAARSLHSTLIKGESGTGKTLAALMIHEQSRRADRPFVDINCAALPEALLESELFGHEKGAFTGASSLKKGLFEIADGGTLFLDEIGEMKSELQAKVLTAIEQKKIRRVGGTRDIQCDVRIITASSRNLNDMIREGTFRADLYYRIAVLEIQVAPLRNRTADIPLLVQNQLLHEQELTERNNPFQIEDAATQALSLYDWPGNIRELQNIVSRIAARVENDQPITAADVNTQLERVNSVETVMLPIEARLLFPNESLRDYVSRIQMLVIKTTVSIAGSNTEAAKRLGYTRPSLASLKTKLEKTLAQISQIRKAA